MIGILEVESPDSVGKAYAFQDDEIRSLIDQKEVKKHNTIITKKGYSKIKAEMNEKKLAKIWEKNGSFEELYNEWKIEVNTIVEKHTTIAKKSNKRKNIKLLIQTKRRLKKIIQGLTRRKVQVSWKDQTG